MMRVLAVLCLLAVVATSACASASGAATSGLRVLALIPTGIRGDEAAWLEKLSHAAGTPVHFAAAVSRTRVAYRIDCTDDGCDAALSRLRDSGLLDEVLVDSRKSQPRKPSPATLP